MAANQTKQAQAGHTAMHVIEMYETLDLFVTDDETLIKQKIDDKRSRYNMMKKSANGQDRAIADNWFKFTTDLKRQKKRQVLIEIVYEQFKTLADAAVESSLIGHTNELTQGLVDAFARIARETCRADDTLVRQFVADYLKDHNLSMGQALIQSRAVEQVEIASNLEGVKLTWVQPLQGCEAVEIRRYQLDAAGNELGRPIVVFTGSGKAFEDLPTRANGAQIGSTYRYDIHSVLYGKVSDDGQASHPVTVVSEIREFPDPVWENDHVRLKWTKPIDDCTVYVFRSTKGPITLRAGTAQPQADAKPLYVGPATSCVDDETRPGYRYDYLVVAYFGPRSYSPGEPQSIETPKAPDPVDWVEVERKSKHDQTASITWPAFESTAPVEYYVIRTQGTYAATTIDDPKGHVLGPLSETSLDDKKVVNGQQYRYTVFTKCRGLLSEHGTASDPYIVSNDVDDVKIEQSDRAVKLSWTSPLEANRIIVQRSLSEILPGIPYDEVPITGKNIAQDTDLTNDQTYHYKIVCEYVLDDGHPVYSPGVARQATPRPMPGEITAFKAEHERDHVVATFEKIGPGTVIVTRTNKEPTLKPDTRIDVGEIEKYGQQLRTTDNRAIDHQPTASEPIYIPFVVSGANARIGQFDKCTIFEDVHDLTAEPVANGMKLTWEWPRNEGSLSRAVMIVRRFDTWPTGIDDPEAERTLYSLAQYKGNSECYIDEGLQPGQVYYVVHAQPFGASEQVYSPGLDPGCRVKARMYYLSNLRYSIKVHRQHRIDEPFPPRVPKSKANRLDWRIRRAWRAFWMGLKLAVFGHKEIQIRWEFDDEVPDEFAGFVLVASAKKPPTGKRTGETLFTWQPDDISIYDLDDFDVQSIALTKKQRKQLTNEFYARIFYVDPSEAERVKLIHPDYMKPLQLSGRRSR